MDLNLYVVTVVEKANHKTHLFYSFVQLWRQWSKICVNSRLNHLRNICPFSVKFCKYRVYYINLYTRIILNTFGGLFWKFWEKKKFVKISENFVIFIWTIHIGQSQWPRGLRRGSAATRLLGLLVRIPPGGAWMSVSHECCVLSGRGLCVGPITRPEESYRLWCVWVWSGPAVALYSYSECVNDFRIRQDERRIYTEIGQ